MTGSQVRRSFLDYFVSKGHTEIASSPLTPGNDPTLLFTNAGMVQFKDVFTGLDKRSYKTATSSQKCLRVSGKHNDLETVGRTARHHTFFEMLGNFSFGDYFKEQAIEYGWEFLTQTLGLSSERLYATVYTDDDDAARIWEKNIGLPCDRIARFGKKDNFWSMGDTGPCGPCSEIHYDRGVDHKCDNPDCGIDCECDRFLELWNLVFMQYEKDHTGKMTPLPNPSIDTGLGLERLVSVIQGKETNFETDLILPVIRHMERLTDAVYGQSVSTDVSFRVIGDHMRATVFLIADGIMPSNEGRGYVLRRIIRRASRHGRMLGVTEPFAHRLVETVAEIMKDCYPELLESEKVIRGVTLGEEESFGDTLENGMRLIKETIHAEKSKGSDIISGAELFKLYDTYGFPMDLAVEIVQEAGMKADTAGYETLMTAQREEARKSWTGAAGATNAGVALSSSAGETPDTEFVGYEADTVASRVLKVITQGNNGQAAAGDLVKLILDKTPFYAESGGQVSDTGAIANDSFEARVTWVGKPDGAHWIHKAIVERGTVREGDQVTAKIDSDARNDIRRNHSATHLLHSALRKTLGPQVKQGGSLVDADRLRFDYTHYKALDSDDVRKIEKMVNGKIMENIGVTTVEMDMDDAVASGAMALFGEKYGDKVRVVEMGEFSRELCGGTHSGATGDIGMFKIISDGGVASGLRRIEAVTGRGALELVFNYEDELREIGVALKSPAINLAEKVKKHSERLKELEKENRNLKEKLASGLSRPGRSDNELVEVKVGDEVFNVVIEKMEDADAAMLRSFVDNQKNRIKSGLVVAGSTGGDKALLAVGVTSDMTGRVQAGRIIKEIAAIVGGGGGGRPDFAQAGGKNPEKLDQAMKAVPSIIEKLVRR